MYDDIINYNYQGKHRMSLYERSAQFSSFQALEGYSDDVRETERLTKEKVYLAEDKWEELNRKLIYLYTNGLEGIYSYFIKDNKKTGGKYNTVNGIIKKIDLIDNEIILTNNIKIHISDLLEVKY